LESVDPTRLSALNPDEVTVDMERAGEAEMDDMWAFVGRTTNPRWLWHAIAHQTGTVLAYVFGRRQDEVCLKLKTLREPFGLTPYYPDKWGAYTRHLDPAQPTVSQRGTQKIERTHAPRRARINRLVRQTICFSQSTQMHDLVSGLLVNRYAFGWPV
jgi:insertion element IS1 protein InsB